MKIRDSRRITIYLSKSAFFDNRKEMDNAIPPVLLVTVHERREVPPRPVVRLAAEPTKRTPPKKQQSVATGPRSKSGKSKRKRVKK